MTDLQKRTFPLMKNLRKIAVFDSDQVFSKGLEISLNESECVCVFPKSLEDAALQSCEVMLINENMADCYTMLRRASQNGYLGKIVVVSDKPGTEGLIKAITSGATDYWVKRPGKQIAGEVFRLFDQSADVTKEEKTPSHKTPNTKAVDVEIGFLRTLGLTSFEIELLGLFAKDFCSTTELAKRADLPYVCVRKVFSTICKKIDHYVPMETPAQLASLLTICMIYKNR